MIKTAMILAAGRGSRMGLLTGHTHKALLRVKGKYLLDYQLEYLAAIGIERVVLNLHHFAEQMQEALGNGSRYSLEICYSIEPELLGTGGGVCHALPLLGSEPFLFLSSDVWSDYPLEKLTQHQLKGLGHLVLTHNPDYHSQGDFAIVDGILTENAETRFTYASIAVLNPKLFANHEVKNFPLIHVLRPAVQAGLLSGEYYEGKIFNANTPAEWDILQEFLTHIYT